MRTLLCLALAMLLGLSAQAYRLRLTNTADVSRTYTGTVILSRGTGSGHRDNGVFWLNDHVGAVQGDVVSVTRGIYIGDRGSMHSENIVRYSASRSARGEMTNMVVTSVADGHGAIPVIPADERAVDIFGTTLILPEGEVKIGDSWTEKGNTHFALDSIHAGKYYITYKLVGKLELAGKSYWKISSRYTFTSLKADGNADRITSFTFRGTSTFLLDIDTSVVSGVDLDFTGTFKARDTNITLSMKGLLRQTHRLVPVSNR